MTKKELLKELERYPEDCKIYKGYSFIKMFKQINPGNDLDHMEFTEVPIDSIHLEDLNKDSIYSTYFKELNEEFVIVLI